MLSMTRIVADPRRPQAGVHSSCQPGAGHSAKAIALLLGTYRRGAVFLRMRAPAAYATNTRVVFNAQVALRRFAAASANLGIELRTVPLAHRRAALGTNLAVKLAPVLLARCRPTALGGLSPRPWSRLASYAHPLHGLPSSRLLLFCHVQDPFLLFRPPRPSGRQCTRADDIVAPWCYPPFATVAIWRQRIAMLPQGCLNMTAIIHV
jgi:hypothetical protein